MKCWNCGAELREGQQFCGGCGAQQNTAQTPPQQGPQVPPPPAGGNTYSGSPYTAPAGGGQNNGEMLLKIACIVFAVIDILFAIANIGGIFSVLVNTIRSLPYIGFFSVILNFVSILLSLITFLAGIAMAAGLLMNAFKRTPENADGLLLLTGAASAVRVLMSLLNLPYLFLVYAAHGNFAGAFGSVIGSIGGLLLCLIGVAVPLAAIYAIRRYMMNESPLAGKDKEQMIAEMKSAFASVRGAAGEVGAAAAAGAAAAQANIQAQQQARQAQQQAQYQYQQAGTPNYGGGMRMKTDRSLLMYILLTIVTCGIYSWYFIYSMARDVNTLCEGDGQKTGGLVAFILLNLITCNIYSWFWYYSLGNRLAANAPRYGMNFQENGTTVLLWCLLGSFLCGIGPFVGMNILIKNTNSLSIAYNQVNGL